MSISHCVVRADARSRASAIRAATRILTLATCIAAFASGAQAATPTLTISGSPVTSVLAAKYYNFQASAKDTLKKPVTFSIANKPGWAGFDPTYGRLYGSPVPANVGTYSNIVITASDGTSKATLPAFSITVQPLADPGPVISGSPASRAVVGTTYAFQPTAADSYGLRMVFMVTNKPAWMTLDTATGKLSGTPTARNVGTYGNIIETVSDGYKSTALRAFAVTVAGSSGQATTSVPPPAAVMSVSLQWQPPTVNTDASALTDLAGYHVYYGNSPDAMTSRITVANPGIATYVVDNLPPGVWYFGIAAYNTRGSESDLSNVATRTVQ
ncbi:MAG TPA: putative Ig domain-containing protein [Steroidobacteraceae bacterium]